MDDSNAPSDSDPTSANNDVNSENDIQESVDAAAEKVQESLTLEKRHKFWETQPVVQFKDFRGPRLPEGPIEQRIPVSEVKQDPYNLPAPFEWITCDIDSEEVYAEVHNLLTHHYYENEETSFSYDFSKDFLRWALHPPGYNRNWLIGVKAKTSKKLVGFIAAISTRIRVRDEVLLMARVTFLCVHKKLRSKRLAPVLIKEVTRRVHLEDIWQAVYTGGGIVLSTPILTCHYWHRCLNTKKLIDVGFFEASKGVTTSMAVKLHKLPDQTVTSGFRKMKANDIPAVAHLLRNYMKQFVVAPDFSEDDVNHCLLPKPDVMDSYLVECPETHEITDLCSFYTIPLSIHKSSNPKHSMLKVAGSYYNVSTRTPLVQLMKDALIIAKQTGFDAFSVLDVMHNEVFLRELKFVPSDSNLHYYLYNYRLNQTLRSSEVGLVLF